MDPYFDELRRNSVSFQDRGSKSELRDLSRSSKPIHRPQAESDDSRLDRKTRQLFDEWQKIERKAEELRRETNRLRVAKDEAKKMVLQNFPHLFRNSELNLNKVVSSGESSTASSASSSLDDDGNTSKGRFKNDKLQRRLKGPMLSNFFLTKLKLSNELCDVYDMLQKMNENDVSGDVTLTSDLMKFNRPTPTVASRQKQFNNFSDLNKQHQFQGPLGQLLCQLKVDYGQMLNTQQQEEQKHLMKEGQIVPPSGLGPGQGSPIPYGFVPMPVDYETYCRWMSQFGPSGTHGNGFAPGPTPQILLPTPTPQTANNQLFNQQAFQTHLAPSVNEREPVIKQVHRPARFMTEVEDGEDTSQDAADLVSSHDEVKIQDHEKTLLPQLQQQRSENPAAEPIVDHFETKEVTDPPKPLTVQKHARTDEVVAPKNTNIGPTPEVAKKEEVQAGKRSIAVSAQSQGPKLNNNQKLNDEDENFMIESDNVDENLYSSESETTTSTRSSTTSTDPGAAKKPAPVQPKLKFSSTSSSIDAPVKTKPTLPEPSKIGPPAIKPENQTKSIVHLDSDSDSPPPVRRSGGVAAIKFSPRGPVEDLEISGPENELDDDDFWN